MSGAKRSGGRWDGTLLGIIGGMGTLASAQFVRTIYEQNPCSVEQDAPHVVLHSDPAFRDRSQAILSDCDPGISDRLARHLQHLRDVGATRFVCCCVTLHHFLPKVPAQLRADVISLVDLMVDTVACSGERTLVICTSGIRRSRILERHRRWSEIEALVCLPTEGEQAAVHELLYRVKAKPVDGSDLLRRRHERWCATRRLYRDAPAPHRSARSARARTYRIEDPLFRLAEGPEEFLNA